MEQVFTKEKKQTKKLSYDTPYRCTVLEYSTVPYSPLFFDVIQAPSEFHVRTYILEDPITERKFIYMYVGVRTSSTMIPVVPYGRKFSLKFHV